MHKKLKIQRDMIAQVIINIDEVKVVLDDCKIFADNSDSERIIFQAQDPDNSRRTVQVVISKVADVIKISNKG